MYHVGVSNIFELLDDENDEEGRKKSSVSLPKQDTNQSKSKAVIQTGKEQPRKNEQVSQGSSQVTAAAPKPEKRPRLEGGEGEAERKNQTRRPREPRPERKERSGPPVATNDKPTEGGDKPPKRDNKERDHSKFSQAQRGNKRIYDRKSGTGRGKEIKKGGGGRRNWGKGEEETTWVETPAVEQESEESKRGDAASKQDSAVSAPPPVKEESEEEKKIREEEEKKRKEEEEREAKLMTYEDYLKKKESEKNEKSSIIPGLPTLRKPGEGVDQNELSQWAKFTPIKRAEEEDKSSEGEGKKEKKKESKKQAVPVDSLFKVQTKKPRNPKPERTERTERSESSGKREFKDSPRGGKRGRGGSERAPNVKDASSFPALSNPPTNKV